MKRLIWVVSISVLVALGLLVGLYAGQVNVVTSHPLGQAIAQELFGG